MNAIACATSTPAEEYATADQWAEFLKPVAMAVRVQPSEKEFKVRVATLAHAMKVPAAWLAQPWRQAEAMRKFAWWPAVSDLAEWLDDDLKAERESRDRKQRLALAGPKPVAELLDMSAPRERTPAEIAHVRASARRLEAELNERAATPAGMHARPCTLSEGAMLAHYRRLAAEGNTAAAVRVAAIEQRMGLDA